jgi:alkanesulfonate monooxygenase SsuD/methylene tetrahydromethanopterin reductase-like flavin-dependent oxidoreductase (luciferase family)
VENGIRLGIFVPNQKNAFFLTSAEGSTDATYENVRTSAVVGEEIGLSFLLPVARWKGLKGENVDFCPYGLETITLTGGLLEATSRITVFTTIHADLFNPVIAANMGASLDHIGDGRWGMNIVAGWNAADFASMGLMLREHSDRYAHARAWLQAVRDLWINGESSSSTEFWTLDGAECRPRPVQRGGPVVVNAGHSPTGMQFAVENADYLFTTDANAETFQTVTKGHEDKDVGYIGRRFVIVRETQGEAEAVVNAIVAGGDRRAQAQLSAHGNRPVAEVENELADPGQMRTAILGQATIGSPDQVATDLAGWAVESAVDGICLTLFDYERDLTLLGDKVFEKLGNELSSRGKQLVLEK